MSVFEKLKSAGFKPEANTDGEFKPLVGTYAGAISVLRADVDGKNGNAKFYQLEVKPEEVLEGDTFGEKFTFRRRYYIDDAEKGVENLKKLINDLFTCGVELDATAGEAGFEAGFEKAIGAKAYVRAWAWTPEGKSPVQQFVIQKAGIAEKKRGAATVGF